MQPSHMASVASPQHTGKTRKPNFVLWGTAQLQL